MDQNSFACLKICDVENTWDPEINQSLLDVQDCSIFGTSPLLFWVFSVWLSTLFEMIPDVHFSSI